MSVDLYAINCPSARFTEYKPHLCPARRQPSVGNVYCGHWRVIDCSTALGEDRDIIECTKCGERRESRCTYYTEQT